MVPLEQNSFLLGKNWIYMKDEPASRLWKRFVLIAYVVPVTLKEWAMMKKIVWRHKVE